MSDHTLASVSRTNESAEGVFHVRIPRIFARAASLWVWRSVCRLSDSIRPISCLFVGVSVSQPSHVSGAKVTCGFEYLQFSQGCRKETPGGTLARQGGRRRRRTIAEWRKTPPPSPLCADVLAWQEGNTWWCCSSGGGTELSQCAPLAFSPFLSVSLSLCPPCPPSTGSAEQSKWLRLFLGEKLLNNKAPLLRAVISSSAGLSLSVSHKTHNFLSGAHSHTHTPLFPLPHLSPSLCPPSSLPFSPCLYPSLSLSWMSPLLMVAAGIHAPILSKPLADFGWEG